MLPGSKFVLVDGATISLEERSADDEPEKSGGYRVARSADDEPEKSGGYRMARSGEDEPEKGHEY